jgi:hypothetical protein
VPLRRRHGTHARKVLKSQRRAPIIWKGHASGTHCLYGQCGLRTHPGRVSKAPLQQTQDRLSSAIPGAHPPVVAAGCKDPGIPPTFPPRYWNLRPTIR